MSDGKIEKVRRLPLPEEIPLERMPWVFVEVARSAEVLVIGLRKRGLGVKGGGRQQIRAVKTVMYNDVYDAMRREGFTDGQIRKIVDYTFDAIMLFGPTGGAPN